MASFSATRSELRLAWLVRAATVELRLRLLVDTLKAGFDPNQPRVPAGNPRGGEWTDGEARALEEDEAQLAQGERLRGYRIDLEAEDARGGHTIDKHVHMGEDYLLTRVREEAALIIGRGDYFRGLSIGSFESLQSATRLVNATLSRNPATVNLVVSGEREKLRVSAQFGTVTGYEAYLPTFHSKPYMRETYGVDVIIVHDPRAENGFRVLSAFPAN